MVHLSLRLLYLILLEMLGTRRIEFRLIILWDSTHIKKYNNLNFEKRLINMRYLINFLFVFIYVIFMILITSFLLINQIDIFRILMFLVGYGILGILARERVI